jgi:hypothetical protein
MTKNINRKAGRPVRCIETDTMFPMIKIAAKALHCNSTRIVESCKYGWRVKGFTFEYI